MAFLKGNVGYSSIDRWDDDGGASTRRSIRRSPWLMEPRAVQAFCAISAENAPSGWVHSANKRSTWRPQSASYHTILGGRGLR
jgi:hypothetical protein